MPQVTVYIRNDDLPKWKAIPKKAAWMHEHLKSHIPIKPLDKIEWAEVYGADAATTISDLPKEPKIVRSPKQAKDVIEALPAKDKYSNTRIDSGYISKSYSARKRK